MPSRSFCTTFGEEVTRIANPGFQLFANLIDLSRSTCRDRSIRLATCWPSGM